MLDVQLRRIVPKAAGTYFIVRDNSQVEEIQNESKMRLFFINVEQGPINMAISFAQGDTAGFTSVFGRGNRMMLKKGNFSIQTCLDALSAGPITVVNLRAFDDTKDKCEVTGFNTNNLKLLTSSVQETPYRKLFNINTFWTPNYDKMNDVVENTVLNFANIGNAPFSVFVTFSKYVNLVTSEGDKSLANCSMEIDEYPALNFDTLVKDTIVDVYLFNTTFDPTTVSTNKYYGHLFNEDGNIALNRLDELCAIPEAGFVKVFTGSVIPNLKNEQGEEISINSVVNQYFMETGLICDINDDMFEQEYSSANPFIDATGFSFFDEDGKRKENVSGTILSHLVPTDLTIDKDGCDIDSQAGYIKVEKVVTDKNSFLTNYGSGIRYGNSILGIDRVVNVTSIELIEDVEELTEDTMVKITCDGPVKFTAYESENQVGDIIYKSLGTVAPGKTVNTTVSINSPENEGKMVRVKGTITNADMVELDDLVIDENGVFYFGPEAGFPLTTGIESKFTTKIKEDANKNVTVKLEIIDVETNTVLTSATETFDIIGLEYKPDSIVLKYNSIFATGMVKPTNLKAYIPRTEQFINGTSSRQNEILDMMNDPGIVKGLCGIRGLRYIVDCFKSYVESSYKYQYGQLVNTLDEKNRFVRFIGNDVFVEDLQKSKNPLFKQTPNGSFDISYLEDGGNRNMSTKLLTKFSVGDEFCFFFGPEEKVNNIPVGLAGKISNLFYQKENAFDVLANTTGIVDGISELGYPFDDNDRMYCEKFRYNPVIYLRNAYRIYGNLTAKSDKTAQQQITNSELLAYIKEQLYNISMTENFKRGTYDDYLRTETQCKEFMSSLVLAGVIDADFVCECNASNNTLEIRKQKIKLVHIEYTPVDVLEKVVFDLTIN